MNFDYPEGATPLDPDEAQGLLLSHITSRTERDRWEQEDRMDLHLAVKIVCLYVLVAAGETLNGILRTLYLNKRFGAASAKRIAMLPALLLCLLICYLYVPTLGISTDTGLVFLGISLAAFMLFFDIVMGRCVARASWSAILDDFNIFKGNLLAAGMVVMAFCPLLASRLPRI